MKPKKCKVCREIFTPIRQLQPTCQEMDCMIEYANRHLNKKAKEKKTQAFREKKKFRESDVKVLKQLAQKIFNQFIRIRDKDLPCVSCKKIIGANEVSHASHFRPATNSRLRYDERNVHRSCVKCNVFLSSNAIKYKEALVIKLGAEVVEELESTNEPYRYTAEELQEIITKYREKIKRISQ